MVLLCVNITANAQNLGNKKIDVSYKKTFLAEVIKDLKTRYQISFTYANKSISLDSRITLKLKNQNLSTVLDAVCKQANISWQEISGQIILKPSKKAEVNYESKIFQTIRGKVVDKDSQLPLIGVSIRIISTNPAKGAVTDVNGNFRINEVNVGRQHLLVSYIGYETINNPELLLSSGKELVLTLEMKESINNLNDVIVSDSRDRSAPVNTMASVSARSFSTEETSRYAGGVFDPARMVQNFPGVTINDDLSNNIIIRGNSPKNLQWRLEGIEINNPNHFGEEGSSGGGISMISANMITKSDFFTGAFPAEYGNALSGVFDLQFRKGNTEKAERSFMIGVLGTELSLEGPFKKGKNSSYLFNYRYSTLGILEQIGIDPAGDNPTPIYQDLAFNLNFPTEKAGTFSLFGIGGIGTQNAEAKPDFTRWEDFQDKFNQKLSYTSFSGGIKNLKMIGTKGYLKNILSLSYGRVRDDTDTLTNTYDANLYARDNYVNSAIRYSSLVNYKISKKSTLRTGFVGSLLGYDLNSLSYRKDLDKLSEFINENGKTYLLQTYAQWKHDFSEQLTVNTGMHLNYFGLSEKFNIEPRIGLNYKVTENNNINFGFGLHSRVEPMLLYFAKNEKPDGSQVTSNSKLDLTKSAHFVLGFEQRLTQNLKFKVETYCQNMYNVPVSTDINHPVSTLNIDNSYVIYNRNYSELQNKGKGANYGIELSLERNLSNGFYFLANGSVYNSTFKTIDNKNFDTNYNGKYSANLVLGKEYKLGNNDKNLLGLNFKSMLNGGRRYTPINLAASIQEDYPVVYENKINTLKTKDYYRVDFAINYRVNRPKVNHFFIIDIQNILNRENEYGEFYNSDKKMIETIYHNGILPTLNYKIQF